jgi:hypothetical protein
MVRFVVPVALALVLPSCGGSDVSCAYESAGVQVACAEFVFSGDSQGADVSSLEQMSCTEGGGSVVASCATTHTLGTCTLVDSADGATLTGIEYLYAVDGLTAAEAQSKCTQQNGVNGVTATWSAN